MHLALGQAEETYDGQAEETYDVGEDLQADIIVSEQIITPE